MLKGSLLIVILYCWIIIIDKLTCKLYFNVAAGWKVKHILITLYIVVLFVLM